MNILEKLGRFLKQEYYSGYNLLGVVWDKVNEIIENVNNNFTEVTNKFNTKTDLNGDHKGTWQGYHPSQVDAAITSIINNHETRLNGHDSSLADITQNKMDKNTTDISITQINKNLGKIDQTYLSDELLQQIAGTASINTTLAGRSLIGSEVNLKTITPELLSFVKQSKNLFNKETYNHAKVISSSNGELVDSVSFHTSDYIPVLPNTVYTRNSAAMCGFYDKNKNFISSVGTGRQVTTPSNCCYVRVSLPTNMLTLINLKLVILKQHMNLIKL